MVIVQIIGGTASQMSAFMKGYLVAKQLGKELVLDVSDYINGYKFIYALDYFHLDYRKLKYMHASPHVISEQVIPKEFLEQYHPYVIRTGEISFDTLCKTAEEHKDRVIYLVGETAELPEEMPEAKELFQVEENAFLEYFKKEIQGKQSVAVHVRRTDFVPLGCNNEYAYYEAAIRYVQERIPDAVFYIFSDDLNAVKEALGTSSQYRYVNVPGGFVTDVVELLCMSLCNHRIMTVKSGFSVWAAKLNQNPDAINIAFSEEPSDAYITMNKAMVTEYVNRVKKEDPDISRFDWCSEERVILHALDTNETVDEALHCLCKMAFDCGGLTEEQFDRLYYYYESLLILKEQYEQAEQAIFKHLERCPDSVEANCNMAVVKKLLGKNMAAYSYASRLCRETMEPAYTELFVNNFYYDTTFAYFKKLCTMPRMHFVICPTSSPGFYKKHCFSLAIILRLLGHEVSVMSASALKVSGNPSAMLFVKNATELDSSYHHGVKVYPFAVIEGRQLYAEIIDILAKSAALPTVVVGRTLGAIQVSENYPMLYWDFSEEKDVDSQIVREYVADWEKWDVILRHKAKAIISTDNINKKNGEEKTKFVEPYVKQKSYWFDKELCSASNYIDEECFLRFVFDMVEVAAGIAE